MSAMNLPDGEYDIDLSFFQRQNAKSTSASSIEENFALRYGFIPDSMNNESSFTLYKDLVNSNEFFLKTDSIDSSESIIFEGMSNPSAQNQSRNMDYILVFNETENQFQLKLLNSIIRLNKSRNFDKLSKKIQNIESVNKERKPGSAMETSIDTSDSDSESREHKKRNIRSATPTIIEKPIMKPSPAPKIKPKPKPKERSISKKLQPAIKIASKRPPNATPLMDEAPIISESDFEEFNFEFDEKDNDGSNEGTKLNITQIETPRQNQVSSKKPPSKAQPLLNEDVLTPGNESSDDEFGDLAIQLEEVLESDADEEDYKMGNNYNGFSIEVEERNEPKQKVNNLNVGSRNGPISLRGLSNSHRKDEEELSSSEEE